MLGVVHRAVAGGLPSGFAVRSALASRELSYYTESSCDIGEFERIVKEKLRPEDLSYTNVVESNIPIYDSESILPLLHSTDQRTGVLEEWVHVLKDSAGVIVLKGTFQDHSILDSVNTVFAQIIAAEKEENKGPADHFAAAGSNDRIWNSLQKLCERDPVAFAHYYGNEIIQAVCQAWLGPAYQVTAQVNVVKPGGQAQQAHRDYHLGFQTAATCATFPPHVHTLSSMLTLQGAVAHSDMPLVSGPTKLLPFSQKYPAGYSAWRLDSFRECFEDNYVQLPLSKGDAVFFNPALFHAAGSNTSSDIERIANLFQVSSAFGRPMESIDRSKMCCFLYPALRRLVTEGRICIPKARAAVAACAEGYSFPTNLDTDPPVGGLAPESQAALFWQALEAEWTDEEFFDAIAVLDKKRAA